MTASPTRLLDTEVDVAVTPAVRQRRRFNHRDLVERAGARTRRAITQPLRCGPTQHTCHQSAVAVLPVIANICPAHLVQHGVVRTGPGGH
ncbi:MAG: hypothetical protein HZY76_16805 [Anaerolineae bacterium]|nr:MAG: hypothetical protein HZY76_16805 [Anaerolineae bacterium]